MSTSTTTAAASLALWEAAGDALASAQSYTLPGGRTLTRVDAAEVRKMIAFYTRRLRELQATNAGAKTGRHKLARFTS